MQSISLHYSRSSVRKTAKKAKRTKPDQQESLDSFEKLLAEQVELEQTSLKPSATSSTSGHEMAVKKQESKHHLLVSNFPNSFSIYNTVF